jgi:hypothetical protein
MGCNCGKSFSTYATGSRYRSGSTSHVPTQQPAPVSIKSKSLQAKTANGTPAQAASGRRKV